MFKNLNLKGFSFKSTFVLVALFIILFASYNVLCAQAPGWQWARSAGGAGDDMSSDNAVAVDANGNVYFIGDFEYSATFGATTLTSNGASDIFVAKMDADGNWLWAVSAGGGTDHDRGNGIAVDDAGNVYITGCFEGTVYFGSTSLTGSSGFVGSDETIFVAKLDTDGNWLWAVKAGAYSGDWSNDLVVDSSGDCYVTGCFQWYAIFGADTVFTVNYAPGPNPYFPDPDSWHWDIFVAKIDTDGNWLWVEGAGSISDTDDQGHAIAFDPSGNLGIAGKFCETAYFGSDSLVSYGSWDVFVAKMDTAGNWLGVASAGGEAGDFCWGGLGFDADGNAYVTGTFSETAYFGADSVTAVVDVVSYYDFFVAKLGTNNEWQWVRRGGDIYNDYAYDLVTDADGNSYVTGKFQKEAIFGADTLNTITGEIGDANVFAAKIDTDGNWQWGVQAGNTMSSSGHGIGLYNDDSPYVVGRYEGITDFGGTQLTNAGGEDLFVAKLSFNIITGDFNGDDYVDAADLQMFGDHWFFVDTDYYWNPTYDLYPDGVIDAADLQIFGDHWNEGTPPDLAKEAGSKGPNTGAGIVFDLDATTAGNQNLTHVSSQPAGTMIRVDVYATDVHNLDTYEFNVVYDPNVLEYKGCAATNPLTFEENILTKNGGTAIGWMVDNNDTTGVLNIAYTLADTDTAQAPEGEGLIADIVFQAKVTTYGMLSFSDVYYYDTFGVKDAITNTGTATLPVELSAFTATYNTENGYTSLSWTTASETDILGYNVYRSTEDAFDTSKKLNAAMINGHGTTTEMNTYEFVDVDQLNFGTTYYYWLESVEYGGMSTVYTSIKLTPEEGNGGFVDDFSSNSLSNYPNPFRNTTTISYSIKGLLKSEPVQISIYNMLGQLVDTVEGRYGTATWNTKDHATGIYFYKLNTDSYTEIKKMMVTK